MSKELLETLHDLKKGEVRVLENFERRHKDYVDSMEQLCFQRESERKSFLSEKINLFKTQMKPMKYDLSG